MKIMYKDFMSPAAKEGREHNQRLNKLLKQRYRETARQKERWRLTPNWLKRAIKAGERPLARD